MKSLVRRSVWLVVVLAVVISPVSRLAADGPKIVRTLLKLGPEIDCPSCEDSIKLRALIGRIGYKATEVK